MNLTSLLFASLLVLITLAISYQQRVGLEKDIVVGTIRAVLQLTVIGFVLKYVFALDRWPFTLMLVALMIGNASVNARKRGQGIPKVLGYITVAISVGTLTVITILTATGTLRLVPAQIIPVAGMIVGNCMVAAGIVLTRLKEELRSRSLELQAKLALGATPRQACQPILAKVLKLALLPTVDSTKTLGIVQLPGMMTGLILAGVAPTEAIKYQLMVVFMLSASVAITCIILILSTYRQFFNQRQQLQHHLLRE